MNRVAYVIMSFSIIILMQSGLIVGEKKHLILPEHAWTTLMMCSGLNIAVSPILLTVWYINWENFFFPEMLEIQFPSKR